MRNALSFDVEEYFHAEAFAGVVGPEDWSSLESRVAPATRRLLDVLDDAGARATFFVLGWVAERQPSLVREMAERGHEVACHGYAHRMLQRMTREELRADLERAKARIEDASGHRVIGYRAPTFSMTRDTLWGLDVLRQVGFQYDSSVFPIHHDRYGIPDAPRFPHRLPTPDGGEIVEFPMSTVTVMGWRVPVAGGGYFRLAPYEITRRAIARLNRREGQAAIVYLHPWELDPGQPRLPAGRLTRMRHSVNLERTEPKLRRLLADFSFAPVESVLAEGGLLASRSAR